MQPIISNVQWKTKTSTEPSLDIRQYVMTPDSKCRSCPPEAIRSDQEINQIELFKNYSCPDIWIWWSNILQNINELELCFGQLDQSTEQTIDNIHTNKIMKQTNPFCTEAFSENSNSKKPRNYVARATINLTRPLSTRANSGVGLTTVSTETVSFPTLLVFKLNKHT